MNKSTFNIRLNIVSLSIVMYIFSAGCARSGNLIVNGGFEQDLVNGQVAGWKMCPNLEKQKLWLEEKDVFHGRRSLAIRVIQSIDPERPTGVSNTLSQRVSLKEETNYVFSIFYRRESSIFGGYIHIQLLDAEGSPIRGALYRQNLRSPFWTSTQLSFNSGKAKQAEIRVITDSGGSWRISYGRTLWLDEVSLVELDKNGNLQEVQVKDNQARGSVDFSAPSRLYPWVKLEAEGPHDIELTVAGRTHTFRTYTYGEGTWIQPVLPDLVVSAGKHEVLMKSNSPGVALQRLLFTQSSTWQPEDAPDFLPPDEAIALMKQKDRSVGAGELILTVDGQLPKGHWPVTQGIPFPMGVLWSDKELELVSYTGTQVIPFQADVLARWSDGSIRWLALSLQGEEGEKFLLKYNPPSIKITDPKEKVQVVKTNQGIRINTGILEAMIPADGSGLLGPVTVNGKSILSNSSLVVNETYNSRNVPPIIDVEESGPVRAVIRISGTHQNQSGDKMLDYIIRWFFHANSARVDMEHIFLQKDSVVEIEIEQINLVMDLTGKDVQEVVFGQGAGITGKLSAGPVVINSLLTRESDAIRADYPFSVSQGGKILKEGFKYPGDFFIRGKDLALYGWIQDFWQKGPSHISFSDKQLTLGLVGQPGTSFYTGMAKTSRISLSFTGDKEAVDAFAAEPLLMAEPEWYSSAIATGHRFMPYSNGKFSAYDSSMTASLSRWIEETKKSADNLDGAGLLHYGDIVKSYGGVPGTGMNLESSLDEGSLVQFLRTGERAVYDFARIAIDHFIDIDIDHSYINGGLIYVHTTHDREVADAGRRGINGHSWFNGVAQFEMFRASRRIYDIADRVGQYYSRHGFGLEPYIRGWRAIAWQFMSLVQAYEITGKYEYLEAAQQSLRVTRHQRDFIIEEWPYMYAVGIKAVRQYYLSTHDPLARELYLQIMDGFLRLRSRPDDVVNGEWQKPEGTVLGNFPNDRSCVFYNEGAWSYLLSGDRRYVDKIGFDLNWQIALGVSDPTLLFGSADLVRTMDELGIGPLEPSVELPWAFMPSEQISAGARTEQGRAGVMTFNVNEDKDQDFTITLFKTSVFKYTLPYEGHATIFSPSGREVVKKPVFNKGINIYTFAVPEDGEKGQYTLEIEFDNIWQWTLNEVIIDLKKGVNHLLLEPLHGHIAFDAIGLAPLGYFPWIEEDMPHIKTFEIENAKLPDNWKVFNHAGASGQEYVRRIGKKGGLLELPVEVSEGGNYRLFVRVWKPRADLVQLQVKGQPKIHSIQQLHDMTNTEFPTWSLNSSMGAGSVIKYW